MSHHRKFRGRALAPRVIPLRPDDPMLLRDCLEDEGDRRNAAIPVFVEDLVIGLGCDPTD
ncbi:MAG TPA: hypothetical protein VL463_05770 [Kofleriaceae bacterium]|jgi:hypothetical protein|nr:hypothetical protein [Kofleriaceae bacterium]